MTIKNEWFKKNRTELMWLGYIVSAAYALVYMIIRIASMSSEYRLMSATLSLLDSNFYIGSRTFVGTCLSLLFDRVSVNGIFFMNSAFVILIYIAVILMTFKPVKISVENEKYGLYVLALMFILCPVGVMRYSEWIGAYNINNCLVTILIFLLIDKKGFRFLCPLLCICAVFTHYSFAFIFFPAIISAMFFYAFRSGKISAKINIALTFAVTFVSSVYCAFFANSTIKMTRDELYEYMSQRIGGGEISNQWYFDSYYFTYTEQGSVLSMLKHFFTGRNVGSFLSFFVFEYLPVIAVFILIWIVFIKNSGKKYEKLSGIFFIGSIAVNICLFICITEEDRWMADSVISQGLLIAFMSRQTGSGFLEILERGKDKVYSRLMFLAPVYYLAVNYFIKGYNNW